MTAANGKPMVWKFRAPLTRPVWLWHCPQRSGYSDQCPDGGDGGTWEEAFDGLTEHMETFHAR